MVYSNTDDTSRKIFQQCKQIRQIKFEEFIDEKGPLKWDAHLWWRCSNRNRTVCIDPQTVRTWVQDLNVVQVVQRFHSARGLISSNWQTVNKIASNVSYGQQLQKIFYLSASKQSLLQWSAVSLFLDLKWICGEASVYGMSKHPYPL